MKEKIRYRFEQMKRSFLLKNRNNIGKTNIHLKIINFQFIDVIVEWIIDIKSYGKLIDNVLRVFYTRKIEHEF